MCVGRCSADVYGGACQAWCCSGLPAVLSVCSVCSRPLWRALHATTPSNIPHICYVLILQLYHKFFSMYYLCVYLYGFVFACAFMDEKDPKDFAFGAFILWFFPHLLCKKVWKLLFLYFSLLTLCFTYWCTHVSATCARSMTFAFWPLNCSPRG